MKLNDDFSKRELDYLHSLLSYEIYSAQKIGVNEEFSELKMAKSIFKKLDDFLFSSEKK
jgi:hypothetical protein